MSTIDIWLQLNTPNRIRKISATSLTWLFGTKVSATVVYSTGGTNSTIETFSQVIESAPTTGTAVALAKAITVVQEQSAFELPKVAADAIVSGNPIASIVQMSPYLRNTSAEQLINYSQGGRNFKVAGQLQQVLDLDVFRYVRFTGTELPAAGIVVPLDNIAAMFTTEPSASQL